MAKSLTTDWESMVSSARLLAEQAAQLAAELDSIEKERDDLTSTWTGAAASTFAPVWREWHDGAQRVARALDESCDLLRQAATTYVDQDNEGAQAIASSINSGGAL
ncbi:WXG100 family type VII secretion target [Mycobacterium sp. E802]|uniref:WXG100 family type VII secretion target n=1 Tax=Mycobacterium sp. E802 TaxID=1834152 RepID=UPI0018D2E185|nr:WXG100 family type VII secretion target [Mycobacterium sp. E802]